MKETPRRIITVTSFFNEIATDQMKNRGLGGGRRYSAHPHPFLQQAFGQISEDDVNVSSPLRIFASRLWPMETNCTLYNPEAEFLDEIQTKKSQ